MYRYGKSSRKKSLQIQEKQIGMSIRYFLIIVFISAISQAQISDFKSVNFKQADYNAKMNKGASLDNLPLLAHKLTSKLPTDVEKFRAIYTWVCQNITADINQQNKIFRKRKKYKNDSLGYIAWNNTYLKTTFKRLLEDKKTMCTGYAYLIKELSFLANIECEIVNGYGRSVASNIEALDIANHSWNAVKLNNKWYLTDATWSNGYIINSTFIEDYNDGYFLTDPILFSKSHYPIEKKWLLNGSTSTQTFVSSPLVYGETYEHKIIPMSPKEMNIEIGKNHEIQFSFKSLKTISTDSISLIKYVGITEQPLEIYNIHHDAGLISFTYKFNHKGHYDIHVKINKDVVATYVINVS